MKKKFISAVLALLIAVSLAVPAFAFVGSPSITPVPTAAPTAAPTATPRPVATRVPTATPAPTATPTVAPTPAVTPAPNAPIVAEEKLNVVGNVKADTIVKEDGTESVVEDVSVVINKKTISGSADVTTATQAVSENKAEKIINIVTSSEARAANEEAAPDAAFTSNGNTREQNDRLLETEEELKTSSSMTGFLSTKSADSQAAAETSVNDLKTKLSTKIDEEIAAVEADTTLTEEQKEAKKQSLAAKQDAIQNASVDTLQGRKVLDINVSQAFVDEYGEDAKILMKVENDMGFEPNEPALVMHMLSDTEAEFIDAKTSEDGSTVDFEVTAGKCSPFIILALNIEPTVEEQPAEEATPAPTAEAVVSEQTKSGNGGMIALVIALVVIVVGVVFYLNSKKKSAGTAAKK